MSEESRGSREAEMTAARARIWRAFAAGLLFITSGCGQDPSSGGGAGTVAFGPTPEFEMLKEAALNVNQNLSATLKIDGGPTTPMNVNKDTGVPSLSVSLPAGTHTFLISYSIPHAKAPDGLLLGEASATREITANIPNEVKDELKLITTDTSDPDLRFDKDKDGASNLFEIRVGTDPFNDPVEEKPVGATQVAAGRSHSCALIDDGTVRCWGLNDKGQLGDGTLNDSNEPGPVMIDKDSPLTGATSVATSENHTCARVEEIINGQKTDTVRCWGDNSFGQLGQSKQTKPISTWAIHPLNGMGQPLSSVVRLATGASHTCVIVASQVRCWGKNDKGQLGYGDTIDRTNWGTTIPKLDGVQLVSAGREHTCALVYGDIRCWGDNTRQQLGIDKISQSYSPADPVTFPLGFSYAKGSLTAGAEHTCVLLFPDPSASDGGVWCWGSNSQAQLGQPRTKLASSKDPLFVEDIIPAARSVEAGQAHTCTQSGPPISGGPVRCWGSNINGQLGGPPTEISSARPLLVPGISTAKSVVAGGSHSCALLNNGAVWCWGKNDQGQLGNGTTGGDSPTPVQVRGLQAVFQDALP